MRIFGGEVVKFWFFYLSNCPLEKWKSQDHSCLLSLTSVVQVHVAVD